MYDIIESFLSSVIPIIIHYKIHLNGILGKIDIPFYTFVVGMFFTIFAIWYHKRQSRIDVIYFVRGYDDIKNFLTVSRNRYGEFVIQIIINNIQNNNLNNELIVKSPSFCTLSCNEGKADNFIKGTEDGIIINLNKLQSNKGYINVRLPLIIRQTDNAKTPRSEQSIRCKLNYKSYIRKHLHLDELTEKNILDIKSE